MMVYYGGVLVANSDLYHHGILGQKWGRRNGPPYPLRAGAHSAAEKKAGYQKSIRGSGGGSYSGKAKKRYHEYTKITDDMSAEEKAKAAHDNSVKARSNALKALADAKRARGKTMKYNQKMRLGKENKITDKERRSAEIMNIAMDQYDEAKLHASKKEIDAILSNKEVNDIVVSTVAWSALVGGGAAIPAIISTFHHETAKEYLEAGKKSKIIDKNKKESLTGDNTFGNSIYSPKEQKAKLDKAKKNNVYDSDFMEQIQNSYILNDDKKDHTKEINKEYENYLKDPDKYRKRARELKQYGNDNTFGSAKEDRKKAKVEKRVRQQLAEMKKNNPQQYEQIKKNTIDKGKASDIKYFVDDMNNTELQYVIDRLDKKAKINALSNKEVKTNWDKVKDFSDKMKIVADFTNNAANIYNNLSRMTPNEKQEKK